MVEEISPPIEKPEPKEEAVIHRQCYELFSRLWDEIRKGAAIEVSIPVVSRRTGIGVELIRKAVSYGLMKNIEKAERLANELIECEVEKRNG